MGWVIVFFTAVDMVYIREASIDMDEGFRVHVGKCTIGWVEVMERGIIGQIRSSNYPMVY